MRKQVSILIVACLFLGGVAGWILRGGEGHPHHEHTHEAEDGTVYTCSMHPQIRQNEPGKCPICGMALIPVGSKGNGESGPYILEMTPEAVALANVATTRVKSGSTSSSLRLTGKIQADEQRSRSIAANYPGRIDHLYVNFTGQEVTTGQKLATLYSPELVNAQKELLETVKIKGQQPALYEAAKEKLRLWKISDEQIVAIENGGEVQTQFDVFADASGIVITRNVSVGDFVQRGSVLFDVIDLSRVWVMMDAYESDLAYVKKGSDAKFQVSAYPGKEFTGKVTYIDPILNPDTRTTAVRAEIANPSGQLKPGMFVSSQLEGLASGSENGLLIPKTAVLWTGPRSVIYVQAGDKASPAFEMREVVLGSRVGEEYLVLSGVEEGEQIVSNGVFSVDAAAQLSGNYSMMMKPEDKTLDVPEEFTSQLTAFAQAYLAIKDALVNTDAQAVKTAVPAAKDKLSKVDMGLLGDKAHKAWMDLLKPIQASLEKIGSQTDVEEQRKHFEPLSDNLIEAVEYFGLRDMTLYRQYCPMAFRDKGAYWLSAEKEVRNPYFGEKMLTCGEVKETYH